MSKTIITIGRQFGTGGRELGRKLKSWWCLSEKFCCGFRNGRCISYQTVGKLGRVKSMKIIISSAKKMNRNTDSNEGMYVFIKK